MTIIDNSLENVNEKVRSRALPVVQQLLSKNLVEAFARTCGHVWRERELGPALTLQACIYKQLQHVSARKTEDWLATLGDDSSGAARDGHTFCAARARLPLDVFRKATAHVGEYASERSASMVDSMRTLLVDGTTVRLPRTEANSAHFGHSRSGKKGRTKSRLPLGRMVAFTCLGTGAVLDLALGAYRCSEAQLVRKLLERLAGGALLIADRGFCSFMLLWLARSRGCEVLTRHHQSRKSCCVKVLGESEGVRDELHEWARPKKGWVCWPDLVAQAPETLQVRVLTATVKREGYRDVTITLDTTLLDAERYPAQDLVELYLKRWNIELDYRSLKSENGLSRLTGKTPEVVEKEIYSIVLAHNAVRAAMALSGKIVRRLSPERSRQLLLEVCAQMSRAPVIQLPGIYKSLLNQIGATETDYQPRPPEPRALVELHRTYRALHLSRENWRKKQRAA